MVQENETPIRAAIISLGCAKNLVDSEIMIGTLLSSGVEITNDPTAADAIIINTCSFIDRAKRESIDAVLDSLALRDAECPNQAVIVVGCLPQRYRKDLPGLLPEVEVFTGTDEVDKIADLVRRAVMLRAERLKLHDRCQRGAKPSPALCGARTKAVGRSGNAARVTPLTAPPAIVSINPRPKYILDSKAARFRLTPRHYAYVKIAEGCSHRCSFCVIPQVRGRQRSRTPEDIITEVQRLIEDGVKEVNLIAQDSTAYGRDMAPGAVATAQATARTGISGLVEKPNLASLIRKLQEIPGDFWIRVLYTHPARWTDELIDTIAACSKVTRYVDIPIQHVNRLVLERMRRETSPEHLRELLRKIRARIPGVAIRSTVIVGFPGETEECFKELVEFIREIRFERLGVFAYSQEEGTVAARMADQVPEKEKQKRMRQVVNVQRRITREVSASFVGRKIRVLIEGKADPRAMHQADLATLEHGVGRARPGLRAKSGLRGWLIGRSEIDAPDIDGRVYVRGNWPIGEFAHVRVTGYTDYDLIGEIETAGSTEFEGHE